MRKVNQECSAEPCYHNNMQLIQLLLNFILAIINIFVSVFEYIINTIVGLINSIF